jgi:hypothetical protein
MDKRLFSARRGLLAISLLGWTQEHLYIHVQPVMAKVTLFCPLAERMCWNECSSGVAPASRELGDGGGDGVNTRKLARDRQQQWLADHGTHVWLERNLWHEAQEELADAYNYLSELGQRELAVQCLLLGDEVARRGIVAGQEEGSHDER